MRRERLDRVADRLQGVFRGAVERRRAVLARLAGRLEGLSPVAVLGRGYALVWDEGAGVLLRDAAETREGRHLRIRLHRGAVRATVESRESE
jgi:exodeoxyribonuclease VII large subunit